LLWTGVNAVLLVLASLTPVSMFTLIIFWALFLVIAVLFNIGPLRKTLLTRHLFKLYKKIMPKMSNTEKEALDAGTITWEADLFSGKPDWYKLLNVPTAAFTAEEQAFMDGPLAELCTMIDDWDITHNRMDMPPEVWQFLKEKGFFSFIIPKEYGGLAFSPFAISRILVVLYGLSTTVASTVGVPNSLGPAELLLIYGTDEQKKHYLPRLANGDEVPCFALTGLEAGSDAAAISDSGVVCKGEFEGKEVVGIKLNFNKRYITLAPVATLIGLAFKMRDPEHLIGDVDEYGITCALLPRDIAGMETGRRHYPLNQAFMNGTVTGKDVFIPIDWIIGGQANAGKGWRMLMECLAAGRAVTLPSSGVGASVLCAHTTGAYARIRKQFNMPIGKFEGVEEALARIGGHAYMSDAALRLTLNYLNMGEKSAVAAAIVKYHMTELSRKCCDDAMDVHGGKGIQMGPTNYLARGYEGQPIAITVEGANILTRSLIIFGQGAIRCHPYVLSEIRATQEDNFKQFDKAMTSHIGFVISNFFRTLWLGISGARFVRTPTHGPSKRYYQIWTRYSAVLAFFADMGMFVLGGSLKRKEKLSARFGDVLSYLYIGSGVLKRFRDEGHQAEDAPLMHWASRELIYKTQEALHELIRNFPGKIIPMLLRIIIFPLGRLYSNPLDSYGADVAKIMLEPSAARDRLVSGVYISEDVNHNLGLLNVALEKVVAAEPILKKVHQAFRDGTVKGDTVDQRVESAEAANVLTKAEADQAREAQALTRRVIMVDDFSEAELKAK
jgi:acyl-CoA dehydrogenase